MWALMPGEGAGMRMGQNGTFWDSGKGSLIEKAIRHGPPHADRLVRFADVGIHNVLKYRLDGLWNLNIGYGDEVVEHVSCPPQECRQPSAFHSAEGRKADILVEDIDLSKADLTKQLQLEQ